MSGVIVTDPPRAAAEDVEALAGFGVATVSEAMGRTGLLGPRIRPVQQGVRVAGTAVTVLSRPGDNDGQLGLDRYGLREKLKQLGVEYRTYEEYAGERS
jgi:regulator of RNase E activity RraA